MAKPDDRSDNIDKMEETIGHTLDNMDDARDYLKAHSEALSEEEKRQIKEKNRRREESIEGFRQEIKEKASDQSRKQL